MLSDTADLGAGEVGSLREAKMVMGRYSIERKKVMIQFGVPSTNDY